MSFLALVMIVKDEARSIRATLESVRGVVDRVVILDTGSTDGTQAIARAFDGAPVELHEGPFVDFATTRNRALELAGEASTWTLMLSGDETLVGGPALAAFCREHRDGTAGAHHVTIAFGETRYASPRLARASSGWRYVGVTHEVLTHPTEPAPTTRVPGCHVHHDLTHRDATSSRRRWLRDRDLLSARLRAEPGDARARFYLGQTFEALGEHRRARAEYERRTRLGGWSEEVYEATFRSARCMAAAGEPWPQVLARYLDAHARAPERIEPLLAIAERYHRDEAWSLCFIFAQRAAQLGEVAAARATLFVDADAWTKALDVLAVAAWNVGELAIGERAALEASARRPGDARLRANARHFARALSEAGATTTPTAAGGPTA